jgi:hypothetical protein
MNNDKRLGFLISGKRRGTGSEGAEVEDPDRLPEIQANPKILTFGQVLEIERRKARERREARAASGPKV